MTTPSSQPSAQGRRLVRAFGIALLLLGSCAPNKSEPASESEPFQTVPREGQGILLVVIDGLRADRVSAFGYDRETTPRIDQLASEGVAFARTISASPQAAPSHASILSGNDPNLARRAVPQWRQAEIDQAWYLPPKVPRLPVELAVAGYRTAAFSSHPSFSRVNGLVSGFQAFFPRWPKQVGEPLAAADETLEDVRRWLRTLSRDEPWFAYVQLASLEDAFRHRDPSWSGFFEPRSGRSWVPPAGLTSPSLFAVAPGRTDGGAHTIGQYEAWYDGALREIDAQLGELLDQLEQFGRLENTTVCVVGSFGMQFGESGLILDHGRLSVADLHVPLVLRPSPSIASRRGLHSELLASTMDVAPTLLELAGQDVPQDMFGLSFARVFDPEQPIAPVRELAMAACAIQGGYAVFSADKALEMIFPGQVREPALVRAWYGDLDVHEDSAEERLYDWTTDPAPPLFEQTLPSLPESVRLKTAGFHWVLRVQRLQKQYAPVLFSDFGAGDS